MASNNLNTFGDHQVSAKLNAVTKRADHYKEEKECLAHVFTEFLMERIKSMDVDKVILFIDAGSTLQPILDQLACAAERQKKAGKHGGADWIDNIVVVTNNFSGFKELVKKYIPNDEKKNLGAETALRVVLLPGRILPAYNAIVGFENRYLGETLGKILSPLKPYHTIQHIRKMADKHNKKGDSRVKIISLVTGNWIRIRSEKNLAMPVPLARGAGHLAIKREMIAAGDEVYVIASLGKILVDERKAKINEILSRIAYPLDTTEEGPNSAASFSHNSYKHSYKELVSANLSPHVEDNDRHNYSDGERIYDDEHVYDDEKIKLVTTFRKESAILWAQSEKLFNVLNQENSPTTSVRRIGARLFNPLKFQFSVENIRKIPHLMFEFDPLDDYRLYLPGTVESAPAKTLEKISLEKEDAEENEWYLASPNCESTERLWKHMITDFPHKSTRIPEVLKFLSVCDCVIEKVLPVYESIALKTDEAQYAKIRDELNKFVIKDKVESAHYKEFFDPQNDRQNGEISNPAEEHPLIIVARVDNIIVGWGASIGHTIEKSKTNPRIRFAEIKMMYVSPDYRDGWIAGKILALLERYFVNLSYEEFILQAAADQPESIGFYQKNGYAVDEQPPVNYYHLRKGNICMRKQLIAYKDTDVKTHQ